MVKLKGRVELARALPEPVEGKVYEIISITETTTAVRGFRGLRMTLKDEKGNEYATMLWYREVAGEQSKLGAFIKAFMEYYNGDEDLAYDTENWIGKRIKIISWKQRDRKVEVIE